MDLFRIAVALSMTSNHATVLGALSWHLFHVHTQVGQLTGAFNRLKFAIGGALGVTAGLGALSLMGKLVEKTKDYSKELVELQRLGGPIPRMVASGQIEDMAFAISRKVPVTPIDVMKATGLAYNIFGEKEVTPQLVEMLAKAGFVFGQSGVGGNFEEQIKAIIRAGERSGLVTTGGQADPQKLQKLIDLTTRTISATHGMVTPETILGVTQQAGYLMKNLSDEGFLSLMIMAQAMGGPRAGTSFMSVAQQLSGGPAMFNRTAQAFSKYGIVAPNELESRGGFGRAGLTDEAARRLSKLFQTDPMQFVELVRQKLAAHGVTDPNEVSRIVMTLMARQTGARFTGEMISNEAQMMGERQRMALGFGSLASLDAMMKGSVPANLKALSAAWERFLEAFSGPLTGMIIHTLDTFRNVLLNLGDWARAHPDLMQKIAVGFTVLTGALTVLGGTAIALALFNPILLALAVGISILAGANWTGAKNAIVGFAETINKYFGLTHKGLGAMAGGRDPYPLGGPKVTPDQLLPYEDSQFMKDLGNAAKIFKIIPDLFAWVDQTWEIAKVMFFGFGDLIQQLINTKSKIIIEVESWPSKLWATITNTFERIKNMLQDAIHTLIPFIPGSTPAKPEYQGGGLGALQGDAAGFPSMPSTGWWQVPPPAFGTGSPEIDPWGFLGRHRRVPPPITLMPGNATASRATPLTGGFAEAPLFSPNWGNNNFAPEKLDTSKAVSMPPHYTVVKVHTKLVMNSKTLAEEVSEELASLGVNPSQGIGYNGVAGMGVYDSDTMTT